MTTLVPLFLNGSSSFLQIIRPTIKTRLSLNFGNIPSLTSELAGNKDNYKISNGFEIRQDWTRDL